MRRIAPFVVGLLLAGALWYFAGRPPAEVSSRPPVSTQSSDGKDSGDTLVVLYAQEPDSLNPLFSTLTSGLDLITHIYPRLTHSGFDLAKGRLTFEPLLASSWEVAADGLSITYRLREDFVWDDGAPVTAEDVLFTYEILGDPDVPATRASYLGRMADPPVEKLDARTVRFQFTEPYDLSTQMSHTGTNLLPKHVLESADRKNLRANPFNRAPVGAGPFRVERWTAGEEVVLVRNPNARGRRVPLLDRVVVRQVPEPAARLTELRGGRADMTEGIDEWHVESLLSTGEFRVIPAGKRIIEFIAWNGRNPLFADREVRRALTMAIDRDLLIRTILTVGGVCHGRPAIGTVSPVTAGAFADDIPPLPFDPAQARAILESRGWRDSDGDGFREKEGQRFSFTLIANSENERRKRVQVLVERMLREVGLEALLRELPTNLWNERLRERDFEAAVGGLRGSLFVDLTDQWHSGERSVFNYGSYENPEVDRLIEEAVRERDEAKANALWKRVQRLIHDDQPYTFLWWKDALVPVHKRFRDVGTNVLSILYGLEEWWVPRSEQKYR